MKQVLTFGEILIRQQSAGAYFFSEGKNYLEIFPGGSEANVAVSLARMGTPAAYASAFPDHALSHEILRLLEGTGVDSSRAVIGGERLGSYILQSANGLSKGEVIYDRKFSSFSQLRINQLAMDQLFANIHWFHWTAITPALNPEMADLMHQLLEEAQRRNIPISVDLNYRNKLWQYGQEPLAVMPKLVQYCQVIMGNIWAANKMLGTAVDEQLNRYSSSEAYKAMANSSAAEIFEKYPRCQHVAHTFRFMDNPNHNLFYGTYHRRDIQVISNIYETHAVIDRIGSGDAFMAGLLHGLLQKASAQEIVDMATGAGFQKLFVKGDFGNGKINA